MNRIAFLFQLLLVGSSAIYAQSKTTEALHQKHSGALDLFFYHNTLRMLNQRDDPEFDALIKDIEKMKFLMIDKEGKALDYRELVSKYKTEAFEEVMTSRHDGKNFDIFVREKNKKTEGMLILINDDKNLYVLDIVGSIALNNVTKLYNTLDESSEIGRKIKAFSSDNEKKDEEDSNK